MAADRESENRGGKMEECLIRNLSDSPCDYPLKDGSSIYFSSKGIYFGSKGRSSGILRIPCEKISEAIRVAEHKGLLAIEEISEEEVSE